ncbi:unnamed protein product [Symbiodinium sp. CCMP2456]|nr:unnamed protein product [Symbiodinium sp. CCMP2456]
MAASKPETIRPGMSGAELPKLTEADEFAAINVGDWLHGLSGPMGDLTDGSSGWWSETMRCLDVFYQQFVQASAVKKLQLRAEDFMSDQLKEGKWLRVDKRAASMLLQTVPDTIKQELLANRLNSTLGILGRIVTIYRPGSAAERQQVLRALESPGSAATPAELVEILRKWARWLKRAQDLSLQVPDPSILLRGLDGAAKTQLERSSDISFRANMLRFSLDLDTAPTLTTVMKYHNHLLGEYEQHAYRGRGKGGVANSLAIKNVAVDGTAPSPKSAAAPGAAKPCKFYLSEAGCQRSNCKFVHDWAMIPREEKTERCKACGGKGHMKRNCPVKQYPGDGGRRNDEGKGGGSPKVRQAAAGTQRGGDGKRDDGAAPTSSSASSIAGSSLGVPGDTSSMAASSTASAGIPPAEVDDFLKNAAQVLKMMTEQQASDSKSGPSVRMLKKVVAAYEKKLALVDSGATHPLRRATPGEWEAAPEVDVVVAGDSTAKMRQSRAGTLLTRPSAAPDKTQTIVPVGSLVSTLGYEMIWSKKRCFLRAPDGREVALKVTSGCPEIDETKALELIAQIEQENLQQLKLQVERTRLAMVRASVVECTGQQEQSLDDYVRKGKFEDGYRAMVMATWARDLEKEDLVKAVMDLPESDCEAWDLMFKLGFNRRMRKRMMHKDWIVKLYSGKRGPMDKVFKMIENNGTVVLDVDVQRLATLDMMNPDDGIMKLLLWGAATGRIAGIIGGLPQRRSKEHLIRAVVLAEVAKAGRAAMCGAVDVPVDGETDLYGYQLGRRGAARSTRWSKHYGRWIGERGKDTWLTIMYLIVQTVYSASTMRQGPKGERYGIVFTYQTTIGVPEALKEPEDEELLKKDEEYWEKVIGDLTQPVEMDTIYMIYPVRVNTKYWTLAMQHAANRKVFGNNKKYDLTDRWEQGKYLGLSDSIKGGRMWWILGDFYRRRNQVQPMGE